MTGTTQQRIGRIKSRFGELKYWVDRAYMDLDGWEIDGEPIERGRPWPTRIGVHSFTCAGVSVPDDWPVADVRLDLALGGEGLLTVLPPTGAAESFGLDSMHWRFPVRERSFSMGVEIVARSPFGSPNRDPHLERARLVLTEPDVERLMRRLALVAEAATSLGSHDAVIPLIEAAEGALQTIRWPSGTHAYISRIQQMDQMQRIWELPEGLDPHPPGLTDDERQSVRTTDRRLAAELAALADRFPRQGAIALTGHAHLDLAWLWPLDETRRKARRTFNTVIGLMERYPELRFNQSSAQLYAFVREDDPALFEQIREKVASGQWEPVGGMWVEPDTNMPTGESFVRQLLYGQRFFQEHFGAMHSVCWLPDCFGFSPALPQLLRGAGIDSFFTIKLTWSETNVFPYDLFWWEGLDGSRVLAHMFNNPDHPETNTSGYNGNAGPYALVETWRNFRGKSLHGESLLSIGHGDGGGGVTYEMLEQAKILERFPAIPACDFTHVHDFYHRAHASVAGQRIPVWLGEMYLELHRGTLTSQGRTKYLHRRAERDLLAAEVLSAMNHLLGGPEPQSLQHQWHVVLRNEFHDILPGSSIREVYETAEQELTGVVEAASSIVEKEIQELDEHIVSRGEHSAILLVNPDLSPRSVRVRVSTEIDGAQRVEGGSVLASRGTVPGLGALVVLDVAAVGPLEVSESRLENAYLRVQLLPDGSLHSVYDKHAEREVLSGRGNALWAYVDKPRNWDAWDIEPGFEEQGEELTQVESIVVVEGGPHRAAIRVIRRFRNSIVTQDIRLWANSARLEFSTTLDWHDRRWLLKTRFPLLVRAESATFETAFGVVKRSTHRNTTWDEARFEVAAHRFADLSEPGYGVAILNDGKYGHHARENELGLSLLRAPTYPDPLADEGTQTFTYALFPHQGDWLEGGVLAEAEDLNRPCLALPVRASEATSWTALSVSGTPLGLGAFKVREDGGGLILRAYEPAGRRGNVSISLPNGWEIDSEIDLLERDIGKPDYAFKPFRVHSWSLSAHDSSRL